MNKDHKGRSMYLLRGHGHRKCSTEGAKHESGFEEHVGVYLCKIDGASFPAEETTGTKA